MDDRWFKPRDTLAEEIGDDTRRALPPRRPSFEEHMVETFRKAGEPKGGKGSPRPEGARGPGGDVLALAARYAAQASNSRALETHARQERERRAREQGFGGDSHSGFGPEGKLRELLAGMSVEQRDGLPRTTWFINLSGRAQERVESILDEIAGTEIDPPTDEERVELEQELSDFTTGWDLGWDEENDED